VAALLLTAHASLEAQSRVVAEVPIEVVRGRAVVPVRIGSGAPLRLILDSGMPYDGILLFDSARVDLRAFAHLASAQIAGAGAGGASQALTDSAGSFSVGTVQFERQRVTILTSDTFRGFPTDGVIGYSLLGHYAVEIDYDQRRLLLHEAQTFSVAAGWSTLPLRFKDNLVPWLDLDVSTAGEPPVRLAAYIDCAASSAVELLAREVNAFSMPAVTGERVVGRGLSGDIRARDGRVASLRLGAMELRNVAVQVVPAEVRSRQAGADAILGGEALRRFNVVFDYAHQRLHLIPNRSFAEPFR
jgi:hypothetical protein